MSVFCTRHFEIDTTIWLVTSPQSLCQVHQQLTSSFLVIQVAFSFLHLKWGGKATYKMLLKITTCRHLYWVLTCNLVLSFLIRAEVMKLAQSWSFYLLLWQKVFIAVRGSRIRITTVTVTQSSLCQFKDFLNYPNHDPLRSL